MGVLLIMLGQCSIPAGAAGYPYIQHLMEFERRTGTAPAPGWLQSVGTPLVLGEWSKELEGHPDANFAKYILSGIQHGFRIGFNRAVKCRSASSNMFSAVENPGVVMEYLEKERSLGRIVGPIPSEAVPPEAHVSPFGVIPKSSQPGKWRLIVDLSSPESRSVNDGIEPELCSLQYLRLDDVISRIVQVGRGAQLAKLDIESAYRMIPVHPGDRLLLAVQWAGQTFFDTRLPFGLRSAPKIFTAVADALQWVMLKHGVSWVAHYLDDFITVGPPRLPVCQRNLDEMLSSCRRLGVPVAPAKCEGPATELVFLGFELDTVNMVVRLPQAKLQRILALVREWVGKKGCRKRELQSLLGHLQHAAIVVRPGRTFVRRLIELVSAFQKGTHCIRINESTRSDIIWWQVFMESWNGISLMPNATPGTMPLVSDASGSWGCGAHWGPQWFQWRWEGPAADWQIASKELLPILFALVVWGRRWAGSRVECLCDNMAVVVVVNSGRAKDRILMHLLRSMFFIAAHWNIHMHATHLPGVENVAADALSRNNLSTFLQAVPGAADLPTPIPAALVDLVIWEQPDWLSPRWAQLFSGFCRQV